MKQAKCILTFVLALGFCTLFSSCIKPPSKPDYDLYKNMQEYLLQKFQELEGYTDREDIAQYYDNYVLTLSFIPRLVFGSPQLEVHLYPGESDSVATACISQFEVPPDSGNFTDVAFTVRPNADVRAPFMHGDALKGMAGMSTSFSMDFWNVNQDAIDWETFFGDQVAKLDQGHALVEPYQRTGEDRGKYTHISYRTNGKNIGLRLKNLTRMTKRCGKPTTMPRCRLASSMLTHTLPPWPGLNRKMTLH